MEKTEKLTWQEYLPLLGMTLAAFLFNTAEFMPVGLLSSIAEDFAMTESEIGRIVSLYAWAVMLLSMPLMVMASKYGMRGLILSMLGIFILSNGLASQATGFWSLLGARLVLACAHSIFWAIATPAAVRMVAPKFKAVAMSMLVAGSSMAVILGMPLGRIIGLQLGWRMTFFAMAAVAVVVFVYLFFAFPKMEKTEPFSFKQLPELMKNRSLLGLFILAAVIPTAHFAAYSYIEPFMKQVAGMSDDAVTLALMVFGCAGLLGSWLFARLYERHARHFLPDVLLCLDVCLLVLYTAAMNEYTMLVFFIFWGVAAVCFNMACQADLIQVSSLDAVTVAMAIYSGIFNFGIGSGTWVGGMICDHVGMEYIGYGGGIIAILGTLFSLWVAYQVHGEH